MDIIVALSIFTDGSFSFILVVGLSFSFQHILIYQWVVGRFSCREEGAEENRSREKTRRLLSEKDSC
jgi:hypothetical protein